MDQFIDTFKGQANTFNFLLVLLAFSFYFHIKKRTLWKTVFIVLTGVFFLITSTAYFPRYLISRMESRYRVFDPSLFKHKDGKVYIHVLGGGYTFNENLPSLLQLSLVGKGRLAEGIRILNELEGSILVFSGYRASGHKSLTRVSYEAALSLGVDSARIELLEGPRTTQQEARAFILTYGKDAQVILVTDALHLPRAMDYYTHEGSTPFPAPANYRVINDSSSFSMPFIPSISNMEMMDRVWREWLGQLKGLVLI